ncbi:hypothetical protein F4779DRAFT_641153 [Xylariaceae sp. FL0662B]|nr:hypothetical protein F4779DRAFT_641153 [Xylariaceae sp. FL0662B]
MDSLYDRSQYLTPTAYPQLQLRDNEYNQHDGYAHNIDNCSRNNTHIPHSTNPGGFMNPDPAYLATSFPSRPDSVYFAPPSPSSLDYNHQEYAKITRLGNRKCDQCDKSRHCVMHRCKKCGHTTCKVCHYYRRYDSHHVLNKLGLDWKRPETVKPSRKRKPAAASSSSSRREVLPSMITPENIATGTNADMYNTQEVSSDKILRSQSLELLDTETEQSESTATHDSTYGSLSTEISNDDIGGASDSVENDGGQQPEVADESKEAFMRNVDDAWAANPILQKEKWENGEEAAYEMLDAACQLLFLKHSGEGN